MSGSENNEPQQQLGDSTYTKIFVGGLAWETHRETLNRHFEQFGEILEAVVIADKYTGRSKGYGFVSHLLSSNLICFGFPFSYIQILLLGDI